MFPAAAAETKELDGGGPRPWPQKTQELPNPPLRAPRLRKWHPVYPAVQAKGFGLLNVYLFISFGFRL